MKSKDKQQFSHNKVHQKFLDKSSRRKSGKYENTNTLIIPKFEIDDCDENCEIGNVCDRSAIKSLKDINPKLKYNNSKSRKYKMTASMSSDYYNVKDAYYTQQVHMKKKANSRKTDPRQMKSKINILNSPGNLSLYNIGKGIKSNIMDQ